MLSSTLFFAVFLFLTPKRCASSTVTKEIEKCTEIKFSSRFFHTIKIRDEDRTVEDGICLFNIPDDHQQVKKNYKIHGFGVFLGCKFANWTINKIYDVFKLSPLFYQHKFRYFEYYDEEYKGHFDAYIDAFATEFDGNMERFVKILSEVLDLIPEDTYFNDSDVLKALKSLRLKVNLVLKKRADGRPERSKSDFETVRLLLTDMIELQRFLSINCSEIPSTRKNSQFYGYWVSIDHGLTSKDVRTVMEIVDNKLKTEKAPNTCTLPNDLLDKMTYSSSDDAVISSLIDDVTVNVSPTETVPLNRYLETVDRYYDADAVFEYQELVLIAVLKLTATKVKRLVDDDCLRNDVAAKIRTVYESMKKNAADLPAYMVDGFRILTTIGSADRVDDDGDRNEGGDRDETLNRVTLKTGLPSLSVPELLAFVETNVDDMACLHRFFSSVRREHDKFYAAPLTAKRAVPLDGDGDAFRNACGFVQNIYSLGFQAIANLNGYADNKAIRGSYRKYAHHAEFIDVAKKIFEYCFVVIDHSSDADIRKIALDAAIVIVNMPITRVRDVQFTDVLRGFKVIMNETNRYNTTFCTTDKTNFLIFNNMNFNNFGNRHLIDRSMAEIFKANGYKIGAGYFRDLRMRGVQFLKLHILNKSWIKSKEITDVIVKFKDKIKVYWKGSAQNLSEIFDYEEQVVFNSRHLFALYDMYFMYSAAIILVYIRNVVLSSNAMVNDLADIKQKLDTGNGGSWCDLFPRRMTYFVKDIDTLFDVDINTRVKDNKKKLKQKMER